MGIKNVPNAWWCSIAVKIANELTGQFIKDTASDGPVLLIVTDLCYIL